MINYSPNNEMSTIDNINYILYSLPSLEDKYQFIEDGDILFLKDYFMQFQMIFMLQDSLDNTESIGYEHRIDNELLEGLTSSVRKISKKSREAAKLIHILKKVHFKGLFRCLKELNNNEHIPMVYDGDLHDLNFEISQYQDKVDNRQTDSESDEFRGSSESYESDGSRGTDNLISDNQNLPKYQDVRYDNKKYPDYSDFQIIGIQRDLHQPLGITVVKSPLFYNGQSINRCIIERILVNSLVDKQGLMQVGDVIFEVNDQPVETAEELQSILSRCKGTLTFKIMKSAKRPFSNSVNLEKTFVRALFDYDPSKDRLLPSEQIGLPFKAGNVFEVLNRDDPNFWQAAPLNSTDHQAFLIPSQSLQERIIALQKHAKPKSNENISGKGKRKKSKKNEIFRAKDAADMVSEADLQTYEEVVKFAPSRVPCVLLIGPTGVGKKAIKHYLVQKEPHRYAFPLQDTSEAKRSRNQPLFNHVDRNMMLSDIKSSLYVCLEEKSGELYGIKASGIRELINQGKTVVLDCQPKEVYSLRTPLFNPFVILIAAPPLTVLEAMQKEGLQKNLTKNKRSTGELQDIIDQSEDFENLYKHMINAVIVNENIHQTASSISSSLNDFESQSSWIPASWEFDMTPLPVNKSATNKTILKYSDSSNAPSGPRRYEKKTTMKPSVSISSNKVTITNPVKNSLSDQESDSNSENNLVMAKPIKFSGNKKPEELPVKTEERPVKKISISKKVEEIPAKKEEKSIKHSKNNEEASVKKDEKPGKHINSKNNEELPTKKEEKPVKHSNSKNNEEPPMKKDEKPVKHSNSKKLEENPVKKEEKPAKHSSLKPSNSDNAHKSDDKGKDGRHSVPQVPKQTNQNNESTKEQHSSGKHVSSPPVAPKPKIGLKNSTETNKNKNSDIKKEESIKRSRIVSSAQRPSIGNDKNVKNDRRINIIKKENSSSEISDTSSESELVIRENRV